MSVLTTNITSLLICALLIAMLFVCNLKYWKPGILNPLSIVYILAFACCFFEIGAFAVDGIAELRTANFLFNALYLSAINLIGDFFMLYCSGRFPKPLRLGKLKTALLFLPSAIELVMVFSSPWTGLIFYVTQAGDYYRAPCFFLQFVPYGYLLLTSVLGIYWFRKSETTQDRNNYLAISLFALPPFLLGGIQLMLPANGLDTLEFSMFISLLANYVTTQENRITRDPLTRLPNRQVLDTVLLEKLHNRRNGGPALYAMMGDLDGFKGINDTYGHIEGDRALILAADILYAVARRYGATAARFGGDEFAVVLEGADASVPRAFIQDLDYALSHPPEQRPYTLAMSVGFAPAQEGMGITDLLKAADEELYRVKRARKAMLR